LTMFSSTIATYLGGNINIYAGGTINVGSALNFGANAVSRGIYTVGPGNIDVTAGGTVDVAGSRIGTFDGGNINIASLTGNVDAGSGTQSSIFLTLYQVDPFTGLIDQLTQTFPGSGIQTLTLPQTVSGNGVTLTEPATDQPGNINISTPRGSIFANLGGIIQEPLNGNGAPGPTVNLSAGTSGPNGSVIYAGNVNLGQSGVIGGAVTVNATGSVSGLVIGRQDTTVTAVQSFNGTVLSGGIASVSAGGGVGGTIIGLAGVSVGGGGTVTANLVSQNVSVGGASVGSTLGTTTASATATAAAGAIADTDQPDKISGVAQNDDDLNKKKRPLLAKLMGRVTVILPK
jgi:fibronectin-binding autotransporter adhesin